MADGICVVTPTLVKQEAERKSDENEEEQVKLEKKERLIRALKLYHDMTLRLTSYPPKRLQQELDPMDKHMTYLELLNAGKVILNDIPLRHMWMMVKYPPLIDYAESFLQEGDNGEQALEIAEQLLAAATENKVEIAKELQTLLFRASKADSKCHRKLEDTLSDILSPPDDFLWPQQHWPPVRFMESVDHWEVVRERYRTQPENLTEQQLNDTLLMAARHAELDMFYDCAKRGARLIIEQEAEVESEAELDESFKKEELLSRKMSRTKPSPLHEALQIEDFSLAALAENVTFPKDCANAVDNQGNTLLMSAALADLDNADNVAFLLNNGADVNAKGSDNETVLQQLINIAVKELNSIHEWSSKEKREKAEFTKEILEHMLELHLQNLTRYSEMMMTVITSAVESGQTIEWLPGHKNWTVMHVLCAVGDCRHLPFCVEHGADPKELRDDLTLIDTVIMHDHLLPCRQILTLQYLFKELKLGKFHCKIVGHRVDHEKNEDDHHHQSKAYKYPLQYLLSSRKGVSFELLKLMYANKALWVEQIEEGKTRQGCPRILNLPATS